jgi:hypothetical protein
VKNLSIFFATILALLVFLSSFALATPVILHTETDQSPNQIGQVFFDNEVYEIVIPESSLTAPHYEDFFLEITFDVLDPSNGWEASGSYEDYFYMSTTVGTFTGVDSFSDISGNPRVVKTSTPFGSWNPGDGDIVFSVYANVSGSNEQWTLIDAVVHAENTNPVPEPATMLLFGTGLAGLAGVGRKKFFKK